MNDQVIKDLEELARVHYAEDKNPWPIDAFDSPEAYRIYLAEYDKLSRGKGPRIGKLIKKIGTSWPVPRRIGGVSGAVILAILIMN